MAIQIGPGPNFASVVLGNASSIIYTVPSSPSSLTFYGGRVRFANFDTVTHSVTMYAVPSGGAPATSNEVLAAKPIAANDFIDVDVPILGPGMTIRALADAGAAVNMSQLAGFLSS